MTLSLQKAEMPLRAERRRTVQYGVMPESKAPDQHLVFVSHSGPDTWVAKQIAREIEAVGGVPFWMRQKLMPERILRKTS